MSEENTKELPGAFDAFQTAKPDEPIFTLQGGDPIAPMLVQLWAFVARSRAGVRPPIELEDLLELADRVPPAESKAQETELLLRASSAEEVSWSMRAYQRKEAEHSSESEAHKQQSQAERPDLGEDDEALQKLLLHKRRVALARELDNSIAGIQIVSEGLQEISLGETADAYVHAWPTLADVMEVLKRVAARIRPSREAT